MSGKIPASLTPSELERELRKGAQPKVLQPFHNNHNALAKGINALGTPKRLVDWLESPMFLPYYEQLLKRVLGPEWEKRVAIGSSIKLDIYKFKDLTARIALCERASGGFRYSADSIVKGRSIKEKWVSIDYFADFLFECAQINIRDINGVFFQSPFLEFNRYRPSEMERYWAIYQALLFCRAHLASNKRKKDQVDLIPSVPEVKVKKGDIDTVPSAQHSSDTSTPDQTDTASSTKTIKRAREEAEDEKDIPSAKRHPVSSSL